MTEIVLERYNEALFKLHMPDGTVHLLTIEELNDFARSLNNDMAKLKGEQNEQTD